MNDDRDREFFEMTPAMRDEVNAQFVRDLMLIDDPALALEAIAAHERTMAMTWQERRDRMTAPDDAFVHIPKA